MNLKAVLSFFVLLTGCFSYAQILPQPGATLNYTQIMFEHGKVPGANQYLVQVALDTTGFPFQNPLISQLDSSMATMLGNFEFGKRYVWRYTGINNGKELGWYGPYTFKIQNDAHVDKNFYRVRVLSNDSLANGGGLVTLDNARTAVDRNGNFVWFLPRESDDTLKESMQKLADNRVNDIRITPSGTITAIYNSKAEETDLNGRVLWFAPKMVAAIDNSSSSNTNPPYSYSHCFKKLANGNYMVIDWRRATKPIVSGTGVIFASDETIMEFNRARNLVWSWSSANYFDAEEKNTMLNTKPDPVLLNQTQGGHMNAFDVDEKNEFVYAGFRNMSRIIKIEKKTGNVVCSWGKGMGYKGQANGDGFFFKQHETTLLHNGTIAVYNNDYQPDIPINGVYPSSSVVIFTQPSNTTPSRLIWKYDCRFDTRHNISNRGGSVDELKNGNLLVCMGTINRIFEVTRNKNIVWSAVIEKHSYSDSSWLPYTLYKTHYASSLYPCYFTAQTSVDTLNKSSSSFSLKIFNDGTEDDSYQVTISSAKGFYKKQFSTQVLSARKSASFEVAQSAQANSNDKIEITVQSKTNPDFIRTIYVYYIK